MAGQEVRQFPGAERRLFYGYIVVGVAFCSMVVIWGTYYSFGVFFKPVLTEFGWTSAMTSGAFSLAMFLRGLLGIVTGGLNDRLGPRLVLTFSGIILGLGYLLMSQVNTLWQLYLFYGVVIGVGMSGTYVPLLSTVARWFIRRRGMMTGIVLAGMSLGTLFISPLANQLIYTYNWRISYIAIGTLILVVVLVGAQFLRRDPTESGQSPYGEGKETEQQLRLEKDGFSLREAIYTRQLWMVCAMSICRGFAGFTIVIHIVPHAVEMGISTAGAANILAIIGGLAVAGRLVLGSTADRIGSRQAYIIGFILMSAALLWVIPSDNMWMLYLFAIIFGFGQGGMGVLGSPLIAGLFGLGSHGLIFGVNSFSYAIGAAIGPFLAGYIFDITGGYQTAFSVCVAVSIVGLVLTIFLTPIRSKSE